MSLVGDHKRRKRLWLWHKQRGACYWCQSQMVVINKYRRYPPDNQATFEHLDSRLSGERGKHPRSRRVVLACRRCNNERARAEEASLPIDELRQRASKGVRNV